MSARRIEFIEEVLRRWASQESGKIEVMQNTEAAFDAPPTETAYGVSELRWDPRFLPYLSGSGYSCALQVSPVPLLILHISKTPQDTESDGIMFDPQLISFVLFYFIQSLCICFHPALSHSFYSMFLQSFGVSPKQIFSMCAGYRPPFVPPTLSIALLIRCSSSFDNWTSIAPALFSRYLTCFVPAIGMKSTKISHIPKIFK